jgi:biopolymer transport protein ExbD
VDEDIDGINVVPLVDVMLVLLAIVLTTATFIATGRIPVDPPVAGGAATLPRDAPIVVTLTVRKEIHVDDRPAPDLGAALAAVDRARPVLVRADGGIELRAFIALTERIRGLGFKQVDLEVRGT